MADARAAAGQADRARAIRDELARFGGKHDAVRLDVSDPASVEATQGFESDPQFAYDWLTFQDVNRLTGSVNLNWRPLTWLSVNNTVGVDRTVCVAGPGR